MIKIYFRKHIFFPVVGFLMLFSLAIPTSAQTVVTQYPLKPNSSQAAVPQVQERRPDSGNLETLKLTRRVSSVSRGFRIQIYSGPDRAIAKATKISFMKRFPSVRSYISFEVPYYKIKVGDFQTRKDAMEFYRYLNKSYNSMIVPSMINNRIPIKVANTPNNNSDDADSTRTTSPQDSIK